MQVAHPETHVTHAVIGGEETIDFGISTDASFLFMLSSNLYKNQKLAVVREVMCNAWDAHIASGLQIPIQVTLEGGQLSIRDFGTGIAKDMIGAIYGTYGKSTKQNDGKQTGGFGLGCKSPFAYTDHFEVTSCCNGEKTIYTMSKSSNEVGGKPGITPIVSMPTTETGITVRIPIKDGDRNTFEEHVRNLSYSGGIPTMYNGEPLKIIPYTSDQDFIFVRNSSYLGTTTYIRYGNVLYPVSAHIEYQNDYDELTTIKRCLGNTRYESNRYCLILMAPPHSISITPSREEMSMTSQTISTIKLLMSSVLARINNDGNRTPSKMYPELLAKYIADKDIPALTSTTYRLKHVDERLDGIQYISDTETVVRVNTLNLDVQPSKQNFKDRMYALLSLGFASRSDVQTYTNYRLKYGTYNSHWFTRQVQAPLLQAIANDPSMSVEKIYLRDSNSEEGHYSDKYIHLLRRARVAADVAMHFMQRKVVITSQRLDHTRRVQESKGWKGGYFVYVIMANEKQYQAALTFFNARPEFEVFDDYDLTRKTPTVRQVIIRRPKRKGFAALKGCFNTREDGTTHFSMALCRKEEILTVEKPEAYAVYKVNKNDRGAQSVHGLSSGLSSKLAKFFGDKVAVVNTDAAAEKLKNQGVHTAPAYFALRIKEIFDHNPRFIEFISSNVNKWQIDGVYEFRLAKQIIKKDFIKKLYPTIELTPDEQRDWNLIQLILYTGELDYTVEIQKIRTAIKHIKPNNDVRRVVGMVNKNPYLLLVNTSDLLEMLESTKPSVSRKAHSFLQTILKF